MWMRGGTSKGGYFLADDLPQDGALRDEFLLAAMGSPDRRQIDGMGGADPLTSKVAIVKKSSHEGADVDYHFWQVAIDEPLVTDAQNCGNILAGVGPFAIERGLVSGQDGETKVRIFMENTGKIASAIIQTPGGKVNYGGGGKIDGVPGTASPIPIEFKDIAGSSCGALLPSANAVDIIDGIEATLIDNGMPCVVMRATDLEISGNETREALESNEKLRGKLEAIRLKAGHLMNLGDVKNKTIPKMTMVSAPLSGGAISTRTFIPHRCHASIGVLGAVSVATACLLDEGPAAALAVIPEGQIKNIKVEHPIGETTIVANIDEEGAVSGAAILRTARKLFDGRIFAS